MSKRFEVVTQKMEMAAVYTQRSLEPVGEEARVLYAALQKLHEATPMASLAMEASTEPGIYRFIAVTKAGQTWRQGISLAGGPDKDPPMTWNVRDYFRPTEYVPILAVRDALLAVRNQFGLTSFSASWPSTEGA